MTYKVTQCRLQIKMWQVMRMCSFSRYITVTCPRNFTGQRLLSICLANGFFLIPLIFHLLINLVSACCLAIATKRAFIAALAVHVWMLFYEVQNFAVRLNFGKKMYYINSCMTAILENPMRLNLILFLSQQELLFLKINQFCTVSVRNELYFNKIFKKYLF